jgi:RNA polymerase subunit RPABC4/transcription elongation factor Spt4
MTLDSKYLPVALAIALPFLLAQAAWIFHDARKNGESYYWLWGLFGLLNIPSSLLIYLLVTRVGKVKCESCSTLVGKEYKVCPHCGTVLKDVCPHCGSIINKNWSFCPNCSADLKDKIQS